MLHSWIGAISFLEGGRDRNSRPVANNTRVERRGDDVAIRLHATDVVTYHKDDSVTLDTSGWLTVTTKSRINEFIGIHGVRVYSDKGRWYVYRHDGGEMIKVSRFFDGIRINQEGEVINPKSDAAELRLAASEKKMTKRINTFVDGYLKALDEGLPVPSGGDCWFCLFKDKDGKTWGDMRPDDNEHLLSHMTDRYYVPSLLVNAYREKRYGDPMFVMALQLDYELLKAGTMKVRADDRGARNELRRHLSKYMRARLLKTVAH